LSDLLSITEKKEKEEKEKEERLANLQDIPAAN
jgi:hypothetical protein